MIDLVTGFIGGFVTCGIVAGFIVRSVATYASVRAARVALQLLRGAQERGISFDEALTVAEKSLQEALAANGVKG